MERPDICMMNMANPDALFRRDVHERLDQLFALLRFRSVSADPACRASSRACAQWLCRHLARMGWEGRLLETGSLPVVFGLRRGKAGKPVVLFYGHYDVQPADPLKEWRGNPFEPRLRGGRIWARGASDNKGQMFAFLKAAETMARLGELGATVKIVLDGEEESGSVGLFRHLRKWKAMLASDVLMVNDVDMAPSGAPAVIMGLRGVIFLNVSLVGSRYDLHSGIHGGVAPNPAQGIGELLASLHDSCGRIAVDGFCEGVRKPSAVERRLAARSWGGARCYIKETGVATVGGEKGVEPWVRSGFMPTIEANGMISGYVGEGSKTIIPAEASLKLSARLVPGQDPNRCLRLIETHLRRKTPEGLKFRVDFKQAPGGAMKLDIGSPLARKAAAVLKEVTGRAPVFNWHGASIPVVGALAETAGAEPLLCGFGLAQDRVHAPNESFSLAQLRWGYCFAVSMLRYFSDSE